MAGFKSSVRIVGIAAWLSGFAMACAQLLGDIEVIEGDPTVDTDPLRPDAGAAPAPIICEEGETRCDGALLQRCISDGTAWLTTQACATPELCRAEDGTAVTQCLTPACAVEQMSCDGATLLLCNEGRTGWAEFDECESNAHCDATARTCLAAPCEPGQLRCNVGSLERCNELRTDWEHVDECETNELCELTRSEAAVTLGGQDPVEMPGAGATLGEGQELLCKVPACVPGERRCEGDRLEFCNEGRTGWELAEVCATPVLCENSLTYAGTGERPRCVRAACADNEHECTPSGVLQICDEGRDRFRILATCIGPPFCNSVQAEQGGNGCLDAPCASGERQCNGPQPQVCRADRTGFDPVGPACETRGLCNADDPLEPCRPAVCQRGPTSTTEFRCQGAVLERCNDQHTGYEVFQQCETAGLCNAGFGFQGCRPPACAPGERRCQGDFVQVCNAERTAFENFERCDPGTCDSVIGECATPCELGSRRCNNQGQVEECRNRLVGREVIARCASPQLCDGATGTCREPPAGCTADGVRRCRDQGQNEVLEECRDGRSRFVTLDTCSAGEICDTADVLCDICPQGAQPFCEGNNLITCAANGQTRTPTACQFGCVQIPGAPDRCRDCNLGGPGTCGGPNGNVLTTCADDADGTGQLRNNACATAPACRNELGDCNADGDGRDCSCTPCNLGETSCNGAQPTLCRDPQAGFVSDANPQCDSPEHCNPTRQGGNRCFECINNELRCNNGQLQICNGVRFDPPIGPIQCLGDDRVIDCRTGSAQPRACDEDEFCDPDFGCVVCRPGDRICRNGSQQVCNDAGTAFVAAASCPQPTCKGPGRCASDGLSCIDGPNLAPGTECTDADGPGVCNAGQCVDCLADADCNDAQFCNGAESCDDDRTVCVSGTPPACNDTTCNDNACDEARDACVSIPLTGGTCQLPGGQTGVCTGGVCGCEPGTVRCSGRTLTTCDATGREQTRTCAAAAGCIGAEVCSTADGGTCLPGPVLVGEACGAGGTCNASGECILPVRCGDGIVSGGEECEPGDGTVRSCGTGQFGSVTCSETCTLIRDCEPLCNPEGCGVVGCNATTNQCNVCDPAVHCAGLVLAPCQVAECAGTACVARSLCGPAETCVEQVCVPAGQGGGNGNANGGNGNGNGNAGGDAG